MRFFEFLLLLQILREHFVYNLSSSDLTQKVGFSFITIVDPGHLQIILTVEDPGLFKGLVGWDSKAGIAREGKEGK